MSFEKMKEYRLKEVAHISTGFPFMGNKYTNEGIRVLRGENVTIGNLRWDTIKCWSEPFPQKEKYSLKAGDIVIGMDGSRVGKNRAQIREKQLPLLLAQRVACVRSNHLSNQDYLAHIIKSKSFENYVAAVQTGTSIPHISQTQIEDFVLELPCLATQSHFASILSSLDDKIELNRQTAQTLEAIAQAIFKEWFVHFNFPDATGEMQDSELGEIPKGWKVGKLGDVYKTTSGGTPSRSKSEYYENGNIPWIKSKELDNSFITETEETITDAALKNSSAKLLPKHSVLIAMYGATVGEIGITSMEAACNQAICAFMSNDSYPYTFVYQFLKNNKADIISRAVGSAQQNISQDLLKKIEVVLPSIGLVKKYHHVTNSLFEIIENNLFETKTLTQLRDSLLPKLMKGEIEVGAKNLSPLLPLPPQPKTHSLA
jgi:type I restriction enzyme, S subunit